MTPVSAAPMADPSVAVVIPCRNEAPFIRPVIDALLSSSYPREKLEVIFVDGMSTDGTRAILADAARRHALIRVLDNPQLTTPVAMNLGIKAARAEVIVRMDAHAEYAPDYILRCVRLLLKSGPRAGNAGGRSIPLPEGDGPWARAVAFVLAHRFGTGGTACRTSPHPGEVDTVPFGTFSRAVLDEVGLYDERLTRNQDIELNARLQKAGYAIVYDPSIHIGYRRKGLVRQAFFTGMWNIYTLSLHSYTWIWRHFVPMCFVAYLAVLAAAASLHAPWTGVAALPLGLYAVLVASFSLGSRGAAGGRLRVAATFVSYHLSYGVGSLFGIANLLTGRWRSYLGQPLTN
jgi:glycosyltransferase involved in cell wall biosynthesis